MDYIQIEIELEDLHSDCGVLITQLSEQGFESFSDNEDNLLQAWIPINSYNAAWVEQLLNEYPTVKSFVSTVIPSQNWNAVWESSFQPLAVGNSLYIRAGFHEPAEGFIDIVIEPQMAFGTGHHPTTSMMLQRLSSVQEKLKDMTVLDMGCGTGLLSIAASKLGASFLLACDNDSRCIQNTLLNAGNNQCTNIQVLCGDVQDLPEKNFHLIMANINLNVLRNHIPVYAGKLLTHGELWLSGFFETDIVTLRDICQLHGLLFVDKFLEDSWACLCFRKH
ncbi:MAG: 50S ribosomal protein L11 methyltransferase [Bacteroidota bacterium]